MHLRGLCETKKPAVLVHAHLFWQQPQQLPQAAQQRDLSTKASKESLEAALQHLVHQALAIWNLQSQETAVVSDQ
jgi:hypothetical protein